MKAAFECTKCGATLRAKVPSIADDESWPACCGVRAKLMFSGQEIKEQNRRMAEYMIAIASSLQAGDSDKEAIGRLRHVIRETPTYRFVTKKRRALVLELANDEARRREDDA